eukprot:3017051-Amphidinium_carterae.1
MGGTVSHVTYGEGWSDFHARHGECTASSGDAPGGHTPIQAKRVGTHTHVTDSGNAVADQQTCERPCGANQDCGAQARLVFTGSASRQAHPKAASVQDALRSCLMHFGKFHFMTMLACFVSRCCNCHGGCPSCKVACSARLQPPCHLTSCMKLRLQGSNEKVVPTAVVSRLLHGAKLRVGQLPALDLA